MNNKDKVINHPLVKYNRLKGDLLIQSTIYLNISKVE